MVSGDLSENCVTCAVLAGSGLLLRLRVNC